jgi:hypothetical protein
MLAICSKPDQNKEHENKIVDQKMVVRHLNKKYECPGACLISDENCNAKNKYYYTEKDKVYRILLRS